MENFNCKEIHDLPYFFVDVYESRCDLGDLSQDDELTLQYTLHTRCKDFTDDQAVIVLFQ